MELDPISGVGGLAALPAEHAASPHASPSQTALSEAKAREAETPEQLAADGDPIAIAQLAQAEDRLTPTRSQHLQPAAHPAGAHEAGKGDLIDVYD